MPTSLPFVAALGGDPAVAAALADADAPGRVVRVERGAALVTIPTGDRLVRSPGPPLAVGDWVALGPERVERVLPRRTEVRRADASGRSTPQLLAANVDALLVCTPLAVDPPLRRLERLLTVAWGSGATPMLVATKADRCPPAAGSAALAALAGAAPGVDVVPVAAVAGELGRLPAYVVGRTVALLGASGVGKSSLVNALVGADRQAVGELRADGKGRHTTAWRELVPLPAGGALIDTPGLRGVGLAAAGADGVAHAFADLADLAVDCRFRDCGHHGEPGCAVQAAVDAGVLDRRRVDSAARLRRELEWQAAKTDARLRAERAKRWRAVHREQRARGAR